MRLSQTAGHGRRRHAQARAGLAARVAALAARVAALAAVLSLVPGAMAQRSRFEQTNSRSQYVHWINLYDASKRMIDPTAANAPPYSPAGTCGKCHDYKTIAHGYHFNAALGEADPGRPGEPWIWTDALTGTQIPLSYRGWPGTYKPDDLGVSRFQFLLMFGRHLPGGVAAPEVAAPPAAAPAAGDANAAAAPAKAEPDAARWKVAGALDVDCMICHSRDRSYSPEVWAEQIANQNFAWASTAALGLASIDGAVKSLPDDFDVTKPADADANGPGPHLPRTTYYAHKVNAQKKVFFDVIARPTNNACYYCHSVRPVGAAAGPKWTHDDDVHIKAGLSCVDCHRNGIAHQTVRGYEGEKHPGGQSVATLSCRGCHLGDGAVGKLSGGRLGSPKPLHKGVPPVHFKKMSCTSCHSGRPAGNEAQPIQTSMAHELGLPSQQREDDAPPGIVSPVLMRNSDGVIQPYRMTWPAFWGTMQGERITPLAPQAVFLPLRRALRIRRDFREVQNVTLTGEDRAKALGDDRAKAPETELSDAEKAKLAEMARSKAAVEFKDKLAKALAAVAPKQGGGEPVFVSGGKAYRLDKDGKVETFEHAAAEPYAWPLAHDVRPARWAAGATGCVECHAAGAPFFAGTVTAVGPAPDNAPVTTAMSKLQGLDPTLLARWDQSFQYRSTFKWVGFVAVGAVALVVLLYVLIGLNGLLRLCCRRK